jgi:Ca-activated chloride channel family protein
MVSPVAATKGFATGAPPPPPPVSVLASVDEGGADGYLAESLADEPSAVGAPYPADVNEEEVSSRGESGADAVLALLSRQVASGLWEEEGRDPIEATALALLALLRLGLSTSHPVHGAQLKKAVDALLDHLASTVTPPHLRELALAVAWLLASGRRTRRAIEDAARGGGHDLAPLAATFGNEPAVRARVDLLSPPV